MTRSSNTSRPSSPLSGKRLDVPLSKLVADSGNPRRTKPDVNAHRRLVASIRSHGLLEPLVIGPADGGGRYQVIAGRRRLRALRSSGEPGVPATGPPAGHERILEPRGSWGGSRRIRQT